MNTTLQTFQFDGIPVSVVDQNGEGWMIGEDIGKALDYSTPRESINKIFERNQEDLEEYSTEVKMTSVDGKERDIRVYNEEGVMMIGFFSKQPKAVAFRKWAVKVLKAYRHPELTQPTFPNRDYETLQHKYIALLELDNARMRATEAPQSSQYSVAVSGGHRPWTPAQDQELLALRAEGHGWTAIGVKVGRSRENCRYRYNKLQAPQGGAL